MTAASVGVLEVGGTHVTAALLEPGSARLLGPPAQRRLDSAPDATTILATVAAAAGAIDPPAGLAWGVAMPDPFDYEHGIGRFHGVGKFEALTGVDVRAALTVDLPAPASIRFVNDADAFTVGEARYGVGVGRSRCTGLTLGTGVGSGWTDRGAVVSAGPGIPPGGRIHLLHAADGTPLEDTMSRRAIRRAYAGRTGDGDTDVREIAQRAREGEPAATDVLAHALRVLGSVLGPCLRDFGADLLIVGGSMAGSWDLFEPWLRDGLANPLPIRVSPDAELAAMAGAAHVAVS